MSPPEHLLWNRLKGRKLDGLKFRRQHPFDPYVLDFYCPEVRLAIKVDGLAHIDRASQDARRDTFLAQHGVRTMRIQASEVFNNLDEVMHGILAVARNPSPILGEGFSAGRRRSVRACRRGCRGERRRGHGVRRPRSGRRVGRRPAPAPGGRGPGGGWPRGSATARAPSGRRRSCRRRRRLLP
ncbi:MAG: DUF559 domain-containing protein [Caulobacteraceae bacterium]|nr:DUF559 domain-containing protein [Caulobacteraceae bacterium]